MGAFIRVSFWMTFKKDLEFNSFQMEVYLKDIGKKENQTEKVCLLVVMDFNMKVSMLMAYQKDMD